MWPETVPLIGYRDPAEHMKRRKPWNRAFSSAAVREFEPIIQHRVHQLVEALGDRQGQVLDFAQWIRYFTYVPGYRTLHWILTNRAKQL